MKKIYMLSNGRWEATQLTKLKERELSSLSGGQAQRVWIAMALAQERIF